ncbi:MAG: septal ring lytic transglycosylase RlpA family protein [Microcoleaceae cyanobacterium]
MKYTYWVSLTTVVLMSSLGVTHASQAQQLLARKQLQTEFQNPIHEIDEEISEQISVNNDSNDPQKFPSVLAQTSNVEKVGEYQSNPNPEAVIAKIEPHIWNQRPAATLYVRDLPILTFIESSNSTASSASIPPNSNSAVKLATDSNLSINDPVWQATAVAAQLNQLHQNYLDADTIKVRWDSDRQKYVIDVAEQELIALNRNIILPDSTKDPATDALQATNRLRRQIGNAPALKQVEGLPQPAAPVARNPIRALIAGLASWYGPGFHGAQTASGEYFNQNDLTAAHRSLPFGTKVRVTNVNNGRSVVVRINDRGPFTGGRVIDLSAAAAQAIGMISSGVARVEVEVLSATR